jgi:8-oxo-dGTP diphosphatase
MKKVACRDIKSGELRNFRPGMLEFRVSVYALIIENGCLLLLPQWGRWGLPGGAIEKGESFSEAVKREVREETGLVIEVERFVAMSTDFYLDPLSNDPYHGILFFCSAQVVGGALSAAGQDAGEALSGGMPEWLPIAVLPRLKFCMAIDHESLVQRVLSGATLEIV